MPASGIKLVDANVWLALAFSDHVHHELAKTWFESQSEGGAAFCRLTQLAILRHLTNAKIMGKFVQSQQQAWAAYDALIGDPRTVFLVEPPTLEAEFRRWSQSSAPAHRQWSDAYLAAFAKSTNAQLVTFDRGFSNLQGLNVELLG
jgi:uncharacterized protein